MTQTLVISGMHRSGTSLVASLMQAAGVHVGDRLLGAAAGNPRGHFEDLDFYELHERSLARQGLDFLVESAERLGGFDAEEAAQAARLVEARRGHPLWGWKDPRTVLFLDDWHRVLPDARYLFVYRHPIEVVLSILRRGSDLQIAGDPMRGVRVWEVYNRAILAFVRAHRDRSVLLELASIVADPRAAIAFVGERLGLALARPATERLASEELHRTSLGEAAAATFAELCPEARTLLAALDAEADALPRSLVRGAPPAAPPVSRALPPGDRFAVFLASLDPAAVLGSRDALAAYERTLAAGIDEALRRETSAKEDLAARLRAETQARLDGEATARRTIAALADRVAALAAELADRSAAAERLGRELEDRQWRPFVWAARRMLAAVYPDRHGAARAPVAAPSAVRIGGGAEPTVLFVSHDAHRHGAQLLLLHLLRWLKANTALRFEVLLKGGGELQPDFAALAPTHAWPLPPSALGPAANVGLVYANTITNGDVLPALAALGCPVLTHVHELGHWIHHHVPRADLAEVLRRSTHYIAVSERVRATLVEDLGVPADRIDLVYEFVGPEALRPADAAVRSRLRRELGVPDDAWVVGGSGTMDWRKGPDLFVQLAAAVRRLAPALPVHFVWVGGARAGDAFAKLEHDARSAGVGAHVHWVGSVANPQAYFATFDAFALVSREDPFPLVCLEAAALGLPIVCFAGAGGAPELVDPHGGWVVPYLDVGAMAERVVRLLRMPDERAAFGRFGAARVRERHTVDAAGPRILEIVRRLLPPARSAGAERG